MDTKVSFVGPNQPFFDRLDTKSIARLLKLTLVLLCFCENLLLTVSSDLTWPGAHTAPFQFCPNRSNSDAKKRSALGQRADAGLRPMWEQQNIWVEPGQVIEQK